MVTDRNCWSALFSGTTWQEFVDFGAHTAGFSAGQWKSVQRVAPGDLFLCYLTRVHRWIGFLEAEGEPYQDSTQLWTDGDFPSRVPVKAHILLRPETAVPLQELQNRLTYPLDQAATAAGFLQTAPRSISEANASVIIEALRSAQTGPVYRPVDAAKLRRRPKPRTFVANKLGIIVTVPESEDVDIGSTAGSEHVIRQKPVSYEEPTIVEVATSTPQEDSIAVSLHTDVQWRLLKLGSDMGLDVWVARNDRHREVNGQRFAELPRLKRDLGLPFVEAAQRTIELIDVLWLRQNTIVAAFEIECTTSVYSGLLRMADLIATVPNLNVPLYVVAPDDRREKVISEVNRATFSRLSPPLSKLCRFISISTLREQLAQAGPFLTYLNPEFVKDRLSESCELE